MKRLLFLIVISGLWFSLFSQDKKVAEYFLGYSIVVNSSGESVRFGMIRISPNGATKVTPLSKINFFLQAAGKQRSRANENKIDYWEQYQIHPKLIDELWKIKYSEYPFQRSGDIAGWANLKYAPSPGQLKYLSKYGFKKSVSDFIYGEKCFQLLKDLQSPDWQYDYQNK